MTRIRVRRNGIQFELRSPLDWQEAMVVCNKYFGSPRAIGGPEMVMERTPDDTKGPKPGLRGRKPASRAGCNSLST